MWMSNYSHNCYGIELLIYITNLTATAVDARAWIINYILLLNLDEIT